VKVARWVLKGERRSNPPNLPDLNRQLKPAYNVQVAVENHFVIHGYVSSDRTDYASLIPLLEKHNKHLGYFPNEVTADSGYCSEKNLLYLSEKNISSYIKLQTHEKMKTKAYKNDIGKYYNIKKHMIFISAMMEENLL